MNNKASKEPRVFERETATMWLVVCAPVVLLAGFIGFYLAIYGAVKRDNQSPSLGLMLSGAVLAVVSGFLILLVGWHDTETYPNEVLGRVVMTMALIAGVVKAGLGAVGTVKRDLQEKF